MSKFWPSQASLPRVRTQLVSVPPSPKLAGAPPQTASRRPTPSAAPNVEPVLSSMQSLGFAMLLLYLIGNLANDWSQRLFGSRAYLTLVTGAVLPILWMASGNMFRGLRTKTGIWAVAMLGWMVMTIPFSMWPGGSTSVVTEFASKNLVILFYCAAFTLTRKHCRSLVNILAA